MKLEIREMTHLGALEIIGEWRDRGVEFVSIVDGVPRPWDPKPITFIFADAEQRGVEVLSLANNDHVRSILAAISNYVERSLTASQTEAEVRKMGRVVARGSNA
jgi:hypothetical protein